MTLPRDPLLTPKGQVRASALRALGRAVERHDRLRIGGGLDQNRGPGGDLVFDPRPGEILVRIISGTNPYAWQEVYSLYDPDANTISYPDHTEGLSGTTTSLPLFEVNSNRTLVVGTRAWARPSDDGLAFVVTRCCGGSLVLSGSGSGTGDDLVATDCGNLPLTLVATFTDGGSCPCLDGVSVSLPYDPANGWWQSSETTLPDPCGTASGATIIVRVYCLAGTIQMAVTLQAPGTGTAQDAVGGTGTFGSSPSLDFDFGDATVWTVSTYCNGGSAGSLTANVT